MRFHRGIGVRYVVLAVVAVPLVSFMILAVGVVRDADREVIASKRAQAAGAEVSAYTSLEAAVAVEHYWAGATAAVKGFGFDPASLTEVLGVDVEQEWLVSQDVVDGLRPGVPLDGLGGLLEQARSTLDVGPDGAYVGAESSIGSAVEAVTQELGSAALGLSDPREMVRAAAALAGSIDLRSEVFDLVANLFGARFPDLALTPVPVEDLIAARARYDEVAQSLGTAAAGAPDLAAVLDEIQRDPTSVAFFDDIDQVIATVAAPPGPTDTMAELMMQAATFSKSLTVLEQFGQAVDIASTDLATTGADVTARAERMRERALVAVALVGSVTIGIVVLIGRWMVRSLDGISASATAMNDGELGVPAPVRGPTEVRVAAQALNGAAANIGAAERQVLALARGDLSDPAPAVVPGRLGQSLNAAFDRLSESLKDREQLRRELHQEANHDGLTGLPNRSAIMKGLAAAVEGLGSGDEHVAVLFVDIDGFKDINDHHGHGAGDEVLKGIAGRVRHAARSTDLVGRLGGDEFVVVARPVHGAAEALGLARRIRSSVSRPLRTAAALTPSISIGVAVGSGESTTPEQLLHDADLAVYEAKAAGGSVIEICTPELREASARRQEVERSLALAIERDELDLALQAIVRADDGVVTGVEALVRWPQPDGSVRQPGDFVAVAERSDLVVALDRWVIDRTVALLAHWSGDPRTEHLTASVNLSARHASVVAYADHVVATLERHGVEPHRLSVELTESALIANLDHVVDELRRLRAHGVGVAIDDFGTGYTSLALLHRLPLDTLKLDRVLTADLGEERVRAVVRLIVDTAHLIGFAVTAEGVETAEQVEQLRLLEVDGMQGFLIHRPCAPEAVAAELTSLSLGARDAVGRR